MSTYQRVSNPFGLLARFIVLQSRDYVWKIKTVCTQESAAVTNEGRSTGATTDDSRNG